MQAVAPKSLSVLEMLWYAKTHSDVLNAAMRIGDGEVTYDKGTFSPQRVLTILMATVERIEGVHEKQAEVQRVRNILLAL
ncbi:MAG: hypothetical protein ACI9VM_000547 [Candidatus Azotimanducaceae bacterium]